MSARKQVRITERLREQWTYQRKDMLADRQEFSADILCGIRESDDLKVLDFDIAVMDRLLSLPLGTKFNGQDIQEQMMKERNP